MKGPFSLHYSDDNKKNYFNNGGNNGHGLKNVRCKQTLKSCHAILWPPKRGSTVHNSGAESVASPGRPVLLYLNEVYV